MGNGSEGKGERKGGGHGEKFEAEDKACLTEKQRKLLLRVLKRWVPEKRQCVTKVGKRISDAVYQGYCGLCIRIPFKVTWEIQIKNGIPYKLFLDYDSAVRLN